MKKDSKIYVAGHTGLVGSAITKTLKAKGYDNFVFRTMEELDLINQAEVQAFFKAEQPEYVFLAAARVGGIVANNTYRGQFIYENLMIQSNVIHQAYEHGVKKLLFLGSTCIYPKHAPQPMKEEYLLTGQLEDTNEPYAIAKIAGMKMCESYNRQYGTTFLSVMPTNLYGPNDNFDLEKSHVLPALLRKIHLGKQLERGNWEAVRADLQAYPVEGVDGKAKKEEILQILGKHGILLRRSGEAGGITVDQKGKNGGGSAEAAQQAVAVEIWGSGTPLREFMYSEDMAAACVHVMESDKVEKMIRNNPGYAWLNIGTGREITVRALAELIREQLDFRGELVFNADKPDGTPRKLTDPSRLHSTGFQHSIELEEGIGLMYRTYLNKQANQEV
jgi:GDP-L-fucose synthase